MKKILFCLAVLAALVFVAPVAHAAASKDPDAKIKREMIKKSIADFKGSCPCPYSQNKEGLYCRGTSAYSKPWHPSPPICYFHNINAEMIAEYRKQKAEQRAQAKKKPKPKKGT